jgi:hypothetical protein
VVCLLGRGALVGKQWARLPQVGGVSDQYVHSAYCVVGSTRKANMATSHFHTKDCPDRKAAAADRAQHDAAAKKREARQQALAHAQWFDGDIKK